jgi:ABC-2 type transport system ATP-binding protein
VSDHLIRLLGITKHYGAQVAVDSVSLDVAAGTVLGLLGRNGAGKTTTISCALGLSNMNAGVALFDGAPLDATTRGRVAYVPETPALYDWMTLDQHIEMRRRLYPAFDVDRARALAEALEMSRRKPIRRLSKGGRSAAALTLAFAQRADMLFLDEPASGLDPVAQRILLDEIVRAAADGAAILFSSHDISQIERVAEDVAIIDHGRVILHDNLDTLRRSHKIVEATFSVVPQTYDLATRTNVTHIDVDGPLVRAYVAGGADEIMVALSRRGAQSARVLDRTLEELFLAATSDGAR